MASLQTEEHSESSPEPVHTVVPIEATANAQWKQSSTPYTQNRKRFETPKNPSSGQRKGSAPNSVQPQPSSYKVTAQLQSSPVPPDQVNEAWRQRKNTEPCFRCGQVGHWSKECTKPRRCSRCGKEGMLHRDGHDCSKVSKQENGGKASQ